MNRLFLPLLIAILLIASCAACVHPSGDIQMSQQNIIADKMHEQSVALIDKESPIGDNEKKSVTCSGTWIRHDLIITAHHCAVGSSMTPITYLMYGDLAMLGEFDIRGLDVEFAMPNDISDMKEPGENVLRTHRAVVVHTSPGDDLAILRVFDTNVRPKSWVNVAATDPRTGDRAYSMGHPMRFTYSYYEGYVSHGMRTVKLNGPESPSTQIVHISTGLWKGSSGGGIFNERGELIGVMSALAYARSSLAVAIHAARIRSFIADYKEY